MEMLRIKGRVASVDDSLVIVMGDKDAKNYRFQRSDLPDVEAGDKLDVLASGDPEDGSTLGVLSFKAKKKAKPIKMANFGTLVGHMIKTRERLQATLDQDSEMTGSDSIREKIVWLDRGIDLFS